MRFLTFCAGSLEEHETARLWRFIQEILSAHKEWEAVILGENGLKNFPWREKLPAAPEAMRRRLRVVFTPSAEEWRQICRETALLLCPRPDPAIFQRLLEAMACETPIMTNGDNYPLFRNGLNCLFTADTGIEDALRLLRDGGLRNLGQAARAAALAAHDQSKIIPPHVAMLLEEREKWLSGRKLARSKANGNIWA